MDLELHQPALAMIEEPEVHLHPGLELAVETYLRDKSREMQMFITTHSTHFVDSASFQNVYLVSRGNDRKSVVKAVGADDAFTIPAELGLHLSSVFMFDGLVFVEGPSDEAVIRELAAKLEIDIARANVGFVQMGGVKNFAHFAAERTLELLARRQIRLHFVVDRDEANDVEVSRMLDRLGESARMTVLGRRELENYLLDAEAVARFIAQKRSAAGIANTHSTADVATAITETAASLKDEVIRLRLERKILKPIYLQHRSVEGPYAERMQHAIEDLQARAARIAADRDEVASEVEAIWEQQAANLAPGAEVLAKVAERFGVRFRKEIGDSAKLASYLAKARVPAEIATMLQNIGQQGN